MKKTVECLVLCACGAFLGGCVAIPCGTQTFTTEYPTEIRAAEEKPSKEYVPSVSATPGPDGSVDIGLAGRITTSQPRVQHYNSVSLTKGKRLAIGLYTDWAEQIWHPRDALVPVYWPYLGNGRYSTDTFGYDLPLAFGGGEFLNGLTLGALPLPFLFFRGIFGPFENGHHYLGKTVERKSKSVGPNASLTTTTHDSRDLDLLEKFSPEERNRIGAWTYLDDATHPQNTFWLGFTASHREILPWPGVSKYCTYIIHDPVETERTTPVDPAISVERCAVTGPYGVFLQVPALGLVRTLVVPRGEKTVRFQLEPTENGDTSALATVRFLPPSGGLEEAWDDDARALLELVAGQDFSVEVALPLPRLDTPAAAE